jgi:hypothetical protein
MGSSGDFSTHRMIALERDLVERLRFLDSPMQGGLERPFSSGHALPRGYCNFIFPLRVFLVCLAL